MSIRHLPYFATVAEDQHFKRAAGRLNMTQSALSRRIQEFEAELGLTLFERRPGGARLTAAGVSLLAGARRILTEYEHAVQRARQIQRGELGTFRVAFNGISARHEPVPLWLRRFRVENPGVDLRLVPMVSATQTDALLSGEIDAGFFYGPPGDSSELDFIPVMEHDFLLALPKDHPLNAIRRLRLKDLQGESFIWGPRGWNEQGASSYARMRASIYDRMMTACHLGGLTPRIIAEVNTSEARLNLVAAGMGVCFVDELQRGRESPGVVLRKVEDFSVPLSVSLVWRRADPSPILAAFVAMVSREVRPVRAPVAARPGKR